MALFFLPGAVLATWVSRTPDIRDLLEASHAQMGLLLMGMSVGSMVGILISGALAIRFGARRVIAAASTITALSLPVIAAGAGLGSGLLFSFGLAMSGFAMGAGEVAMNVEGAKVEELGGKPFLPKMHGFFSLGSTITALLGIAFTHHEVPVPVHLGVVALLGLIVPFAVRHIPAGMDSVAPKPTSGTGTKERLFTDVRLLLLGAIVLALALGEGAANDWLPLVMVDGHGFNAALGSFAYAIFAGCMTIGRMAGGPLVSLLGPKYVLLISAMSSSLGLGLVIFSDNRVVVMLAIIAWGLGSALGFPVAVSTAGATGSDSARRVSLVATIGYIATLAGPPALGLLAELNGLRQALILVFGLCILAVAMSSLLRNLVPVASTAPSPETAPTH